MKSLSVKAAFLSLALLSVFVLFWHLATLPKGAVQAADSEYAKLMGGGAPKTTGLPTPMQIGETMWKQMRDPFYDNGPNDKGIGVQIAYSLTRVMSGFLLAALVAIPVGFLIGMSPLIYRALNPFIQIFETNFATGMDAAGALHHQGFDNVIDFRHLYLLNLADAHQYRARRRWCEARLAQCR